MIYTVKWDAEHMPTISHYLGLSDKGEEGVSWEAAINEIVNVFEQTGRPHTAMMWAALTTEEYFDDEQD